MYTYMTFGFYLRSTHISGISALYKSVYALSEYISLSQCAFRCLIRAHLAIVWRRSTRQQVASCQHNLQV